MEYLSGNLTADDVRKTDLYNRGDCINIWVNQGEFELLQMQHEAMRQQLAKPAPEAQILIDALRYRFLKERYAMANFDIYEAEDGEQKVAGIIFEMPNGTTYSADVDKTIDDAIKVYDAKATPDGVEK
jgi:hypothetical protein